MNARDSRIAFLGVPEERTGLVEMEEYLLASTRIDVKIVLSDETIYITYTSERDETNSFLFALNSRVEWKYGRYGTVEEKRIWELNALFRRKLKEEREWLYKEEKETLCLLKDTLCLLKDTIDYVNNSIQRVKEE